MRSESAGERGFTLIEVLAAVLIVCLVFGLLLESVTHNLADLSRARLEARAAQVAQDHLKDIQMSLEAGEKLEDGTREEACDDPNNDLLCQTIVVEEKLALPADYPGDLSPSPLFHAPNEPQRAPGAGQEPPLRMILVRAYPPETDPNTVDPFVALVVAPLDAQSLQQLQQQQQQPQLQPQAQSQPRTQRPSGESAGEGNAP